MDAVVFGEEEGAIGFEDIDETGEACEVAVAGEIAGTGGGGGAVGETGEAALFLTEVDECGFDVFECGEDGFFVVGGGGSGVSGLGVGGGAELAGVEDGPAEAGAEGPEIALVIEERGGFDGLEAGGGGEAEARVEIGDGDADAGVGGGEFAFGAANVRAAEEEIAGEPDGDPSELCGERFGGGEVGDEVGWGGAEEDAETVDGASGTGFEDGEGGGGGFGLLFGAGDIEVGGEACGEPLGGEGQGVALGFEILFCDETTGLIAAEFEVGGGGFCGEGDLDGAEVFDGGVERGVGGFRGAAETAEEVDFP